MHIDFCLLSTDLNPTYYGLYPYVRKSWQKFGIKTKLIVIGETLPQILGCYKEEVILFKPIIGIHTAFQAQVIRLLYPCLYENQNIIISDIDIIPLNKKYFNDSIKNVNIDKFIIYRDAYINNEMYAMCYNLANSNIWRKIFSINNENDIGIKIAEWYDQNYDGKKNCEGWFTDQKMLYKYVNKYEKDNIIILKDKDLNFNRLDKRNKKFIVENLDTIYDNVKGNIYSDFHVIRPFYKYTNIINKIIDLIDI